MIPFFVVLCGIAFLIRTRPWFYRSRRDRISHNLGDDTLIDLTGRSIEDLAEEIRRGRMVINQIPLPEREMVRGQLLSNVMTRFAWTQTASGGMALGPAGKPCLHCGGSGKQNDINDRKNENEFLDRFETIQSIVNHES